MFGIVVQVLNSSPGFLSLKITIPKKLPYLPYCKGSAWRSRYELLMWAICTASRCRRSLADTTVTYIIITAWAILPWGRRLLEASEEERGHVDISKSITRDCVGAAFLCTGQVWVTDLPKRLFSNKHHTIRNFSGHAESVKWDHAEQWVGWDGEEGNFVWVREAFGSAWMTEEEGQTTCNLMVHQKVCSSRGPQGRLQLRWELGSVVSPKVTMIKEMLHIPDWLTGLVKTWIVSQQTTCPVTWQPWLLMGLGPEIILFPLQQSSKINSQFIAMVKHFCLFYVSY